MKKFGKLAVVLLVAVSVTVVAGCSGASNGYTPPQEESVLYKSTGGDIISGKRYGSDYLDVTITIRKPNEPNTTIASGVRGIIISGSSLADVTINSIDLTSGIISGNTIEYTVSGTYNGNTSYPSKTITFTKQ